MIEGHLRRRDPAGRVEEPDDLVDDSRVTRIEEPVEPFTVPRQPTDDAGTQGRAHLVEGLDRHRRGATGLDPDDHAARHAGGSGEVLLPKLLPDPEGLEAAAEGNLVHGADRSAPLCTGGYPVVARFSLRTSSSDDLPRTLSPPTHRTTRSRAKFKEV